jgi:DNA-binding IclR family transcriptional regulator
MAHELRSKKQLEMPLALGSLALTKSQAACLRAIGQGVHSKSLIAIAAQLDLAKALRALDALANLRLVKKSADHQWRMTRLGRSCRYKTIPDKRRRGWNGVGQGAKRLLEVLSRPMSGRELARDLRITKQRVHQLVVKLHGMGYVRLGDQERVLHVVARKDDSVPLLSRNQQRVFSVIAEQYDTTAGKIKQAAGCSEDEAEDTLRHLVGIGLVAENTKANGSRRYQITKAGSLHPQYQRSAGHADPPSLVVRSDRVLEVLSLLAERGRAQITEARDALGVPHQSINALFQYLKRKSLVAKDGQDLRAPYRLTDEGSEALAELRHRRAA